MVSRSKRRLRAARGSRGGALLLTVAVIFMIFFLSISLALCVCNVSMAAYYNDKTKLMSENALDCYLAETVWSGANYVQQADPNPTSMVNNEVNDALAAMSLPAATSVNITTPPGQTVAQVTISSFTTIGQSPLLPTFLYSSQDSGTTPVTNPQNSVHSLAVIQAGSTPFCAPAYGTLGTYTTLASYIANVTSPSDCQSAFFNPQSNYDEFDIGFSGFFHNCQYCCTYAQCGGTHALPGQTPPPGPGPPPVPTTVETCETRP
jgi:hypothetical protein